MFYNKHNYKKIVILYKNIKLCKKYKVIKYKKYKNIK